MADRFESNSGENVRKYAKGVAKGDAEDRWANLVEHLTGYPMPPRSTLFEKLTSDHGGPLFRMDIQGHSVLQVVTGFEHDVDMEIGHRVNFEVRETGFEMNDGQDYDIWFFADIGTGTAKVLKQARIVFEGTAQDKDGHIQWADTSGATADEIAVGKGTEFTDYNKDSMSNVKLFQYMNGPRDALLALFNGNTADMEFGGAGVPDAGAVDLESFDATGDSFDRAAKFFKDYAVIIKNWEDALGKENAVWKGESADVFRSLLTKVRDNYEAYVDTFYGSGKPTGEARTVYSQALSEVKAALRDASQKLLDAWRDWAQSPYYDPIHVLRYVLDDLAMWVEEENIKKTHIKHDLDLYYPEMQPGFTQVHPEYGDLSDTSSWKKVGEEAVRIWSQAVDGYLGKPAAAIQSDLNNKFLDVGKKFTENVPKPKTTSTAASDYAEKKAEDVAKKIEEENEKLNDRLDRLNDPGGTDELLRALGLDGKVGDGDGLGADSDATDKLLRALGLDGKGPDGKGDDGLGADTTVNPTTTSLGTLDGINSNGLGNDTTVNPTTTSLGTLDGINSNGLGNGGNNDTVPTLPRSLWSLDGTDTGSDSGLGTDTDTDTDTDSTVTPTATSLGTLAGINGSNTPVSRRDRVGDITNSVLDPIGDDPAGIQTPTGGYVSLDGGDFATTFPDGSSTSFDPDTGSLTTVDPNGETTITDLTHGASITNPDGSVTSLENGQLTTEFPDGGKQVINPDTGIATTTDPQGHTTTTNLGSLTGLNDTNSMRDPGTFPSWIGDTFPDGSSTSFDPDTGSLTTVDPNGQTTITDLTHGASITNPDGSVTSLENGQLTTEFPDGSKQVINPDTGIATTTDPQGHTTTTNLGSLTGLNDTSSMRDPGTFPSRIADTSSAGLGGGGGGGGSSSKNLGSLLDGLSGASSAGTGGGSGLGGSAGPGGTDGIGFNGTADPLTGSVSGGTGGAGPQTAADGSQQGNGSPGMPMMPMGGMGGMGAGGDKGSHGERVRAVLTDALEESTRRNNRRRRGQWSRADEEDTFLAPASRPATTSGRGGEEAPGDVAQPHAAGTSSSDYLEEEADVWGTDEGGAPAVIGR